MCVINEFLSIGILRQASWAMFAPYVRLFNLGTWYPKVLHCNNNNNSNNNNNNNNNDFFKM